MTPRDKLYSVLTDDATVGSYVGDRIWPQQAESLETKPFIVFWKSDRQPSYGAIGKGPTTDQNNERYKVAIHYDIDADVDEIENAVRDALQSASSREFTVIGLGGEADQMHRTSRARRTIVVVDVIAAASIAA